MIVTFVSECEKKSLKLTRQVLDAYAHRIGRRTWQTVITDQGLTAVRTRLSKTARKSTAVACHRIRGTRRSELLWIVGNRRKFDDQGNVPVARTRRNLLKESEHSDWNFLPLMKGTVALAGLFHDFGKAWDPFQKILLKPPARTSDKRDPVRHEWVSVILFAALTQGKSDTEWLAELADLKDSKPAKRNALSKSVIASGKTLCDASTRPFDLLDTPLKQTIGWLLVSHHRLPGHPAPEDYDADEPRTRELLLGPLLAKPTYEKSPAPKLDAKKHWRFRKGLPIVSERWCKLAVRWSRHMLSQADQPVHNQLPTGKGIQLFETLCRLALIAGDHNFSSEDEKNQTWPTDWPIAANPVSGVAPNEKFDHIRQFLDEHLVGVTKASLKLTHFLPYFEHGLSALQDNRPLRRRSPPKFDWQNKVVDRIRSWKEANPRFEGGLFAVNLASTGTGKTIANAKIFNALGDSKLRLSVALGLRTLTRQTGAEYRQRLGLDGNELCIAVGGQSQRLLDVAACGQTNSETNDFDSGSASEELIDGYFEFDAEDLITNDTLSSLLPTLRKPQFLKSPMLVCTIDHLMPAVESQRGGRHLLPMLRMLSSDLVIDEVDDFDKNDLPAIARLVHLAGMFGRRVLISSATVPPAVACGLFRSYQAGFCEFSALRGRPVEITSLWCDEFSSSLEVVNELPDYESKHRKFCQARCKKLAAVPTQDVRTRGRVQRFDASPEGSNAETKDERQQVWFQGVLRSACELHRSHGHYDQQTGKTVSVGVIRLANVNPCVDLSRFLLSCDLPTDTDIRVLTYHARQVMLLRARTEQFLDEMVGRGRADNLMDVPAIRVHASESDKANLICIVVASPVEEVGRDHDFDWAVIEPSSLRSIVQMAGRVRRHRGPSTSPEPNVVLPEFNLKGFLGEAREVFSRPGFEGGSKGQGAGYRLESKSLFDLVNAEQLAERIDSQSRVMEPSAFNATLALRDLEHQVLRNVLTGDNLRPFFPAGWMTCPDYLTNLAQVFSPFRKSPGPSESAYRLYVDEDGNIEFRCMELDRYRRARMSDKKATHIDLLPLTESEEQRCLLPLDYAFEIERSSEELGISRQNACEKLGELILPDNSTEIAFEWNESVGARRRAT